MAPTKAAAEASAEKEILLQVINLYREMPYLYNKSDKNYDNKSLRDEGYKVLLEKYKMFNKSVSMERFKKKLWNLKTTYYRELRRINVSKRAGARSNDVYVPTVWYFKALDFLPCKHVQDCKIQDTSVVVMNNGSGRKSTAIPTLDLLQRPSISTIINASKSSINVAESCKNEAESSKNEAESCGGNAISNLDELKREENKLIANADKENFKQTLIRMVSAHLKKGTQMTGVEMWAEIEKAIGSDCTVLWQRMRSSTKSILNRLLINSDYTDLVKATRTDWLMYDLILVHETYDVISVPDNYKSDKPLMELLNLVSKYSIESLDVASLPNAWLKLSREYNRNGRFCSVMMLQKRWYQIKDQTRRIFYDFWYKYHKDFAACKITPRYLFIETANMFPNIISTYFPKWEELVAQKLVVLPEDFESIINPKPIDTESDIEVVEIDDNNDPEANNIPTIKDEIIAELKDDRSLSPIPEEMLPKIIKVKSESDAVPIVENLNDENLSVESDCLSQIQIVATTYVQEVDTVIEPDQQGTGKNKTVPHEALVKNEQKQTNETNIEEINDFSDTEVSNSMNKNNIVETKPNTVEINENTEMLSNVNKLIKEDDFLDLDIVDEGIDLVDPDTYLDTKRHNAELGAIKKRNTMYENNDRNYTEDSSKAKGKFDEKFLMLPIVYTTKLNDMKVLKSIKDLTSIKIENIINDIITESKPIYKINIKQTKKPNDLVKEKIRCEFGKSLNMELSDKDDAENIDASNPLLHKPKNCTYNPINLCRNPDFNTRLKRLGVSYLKVEKNCQLLKACKPITIDLYKLDEIKLVNGVVKLRNNTSNSENCNNVNIEPNDSTIANTVVPTALPAQALIDRASTYVIQNKHYNKNNKLSNSYNIGVNSPKPTTSCETSTNDGTIKAESVKSIPTLVPNILHTISTPLSPNLQTTAPTIVENKHKVRKKRDVQIPQWLTRPLPKVVHDDDILITGDTVRKMLNFFNKGNVFYDGVKSKNKKTPPVINPVKNSTKKAISTPVPEIPLTNINPLPLIRMWYTFRSWCCWVRKYMEVITMKMTGFNDLAPKIGRHSCSKTLCSCCCFKFWNEFLADWFKRSEGERILHEIMKVHFPFERPKCMPPMPPKTDQISKDSTKLLQPSSTIVGVTSQNSTSNVPIERIIEIPIRSEKSVSSVCTISKSYTSRVPEHQKLNAITSLNNNSIGECSNTIEISSEKRTMSVESTWWSQSGQLILDTQNKKGSIYRILPQKPGKRWLNIGPKKLLLTTANISEIEKSQVDNKTIIDISNDDTVPSDANNTPLSLELHAVSDSPNQGIAIDGQIDGANDSAKKSILSDLMEMSGISTVDVEPKMSREIEIPMPNFVDLSIISSLDDIKWSLEKQGKFFTLCFDTGKIVSVIIDKIKKFTPKQISDAVIEIEDSDDEEKANKPTKLIIDNRIKSKRKSKTQGTLNAEKKIKNTPRILKTQKMFNIKENLNTKRKSFLSILQKNLYDNELAEEYLEEEYLSDSFLAENETVVDCESSDEEPHAKLRKLDNAVPVESHFDLPVEPQIVPPVELYYDVPVEPDDDGETILGI